MPRCIIKIKDLYFEWSTIVDAPVTWGMTEKQLRDHIKERYGTEGLRELPKRLERVEEKGASWQSVDDLESTIKYNRAGPNELRLTAEEIYNRFATASMVDEETEDERK